MQQKNKPRATLRITRKSFQDDELPPELFLTAIRDTKIRKAFANNMSKYIKLSKTQLYKTIQSSRFFAWFFGGL